MDLSTCISQSKSCKLRAACGSPGPGTGRAAQRGRDRSWLGAFLALDVASSVTQLLSSQSSTASRSAAELLQLCGLLQTQGGLLLQYYLLARASQCRKPSCCSLDSLSLGNMQGFSSRFITRVILHLK